MGGLFTLSLFSGFRCPIKLEEKKTSRGEKKNYKHKQLLLINARPATGIQNPEPQGSSQKEIKKNSQKARQTKKASKTTKAGIGGVRVIFPVDLPYSKYCGLQIRSILLHCHSALLYLCSVFLPFLLRKRALGTPGPGTECSRALRARNPKRVRKESERVSQGLRPRGAPESPKSAPRSPKRVQKHSFGLFLDSFRTPGRTLRGLWSSLGPKGPGALCARPGGSLGKRACISQRAPNPKTL